VSLQGLPQGASSTLFCCENTEGRRICADVLPLECYGREYRELGSNGVLRRVVPAPLSREEIARREAEAQRKEEAAARQAKQDRADQLLIETYRDLEDIDRREAQALLLIDRAVAGIRSNVEQLLAQRKRYEEEAEFYQGRPMPNELKQGMASVESELESIESAVAAREAEKEAIRAHFAADRARYVELVRAGRVAR
jgi:hypothetical protein